MAKRLSQEEESLRQLNQGYEQAYGFAMPDQEYAFTAEPGLTEDLVRQISRMKNEPEWMLQWRLKGFQEFQDKPLPQWADADLSGLDFGAIRYFVRATEGQGASWDDVPAEIKQTFDRLGIPEAEQKFLQGVSAQYESEVVYHSIRADLEAKGVIFTDMDSAVRDYPELVREYFGSIIPASDNKFAALNTAVWSGGSFIYVPPGVQVEMPLQAYFRINTRNMGQFERTLIIVDEGASVHYVEGCTAPIYSTDSLHSAVVEIIVKDRGQCKYTTIQNWSNNVYNLVTKRAVAHEDARMEWVDANIGSKLTMKYPAVILAGDRAHGEVVSVAIAGEGQFQDAGAKLTHIGRNTTSRVVSKSISKDGGRVKYRGLIKIFPQAEGSRVRSNCDALLLDDRSRSDTVPTIENLARRVTIEHEASTTKLAEEQIFYAETRGLDRAAAEALLVNGFLESVLQALPIEFSLELTRLIQLELEGSIG